MLLDQEHRNSADVLCCKPLLKWPGGKKGELAEIAPRIPQHTRYFEPFFGGGSVYFDAIEKPSYANDTHPDLMMFYKCVKTSNNRFLTYIDEFMDEWSSRPEDRALIYLRIRARYNNTPNATIQKAFDFFILREYAYGGMFRFNSMGKFNVPFGHGYANKDIQKKLDYLSSIAVLKKLKKLSLSCVDFQTFVDGFDFSKNDFMFVDPPYNCTFTQYNKSSFTHLDQARLAAFLLRFKGKFMLVAQYTDMMKELYKSKKLTTHIYDKKYRFNIKGRFCRAVKHALITNYDTHKRA